MADNAVPRLSDTRRLGGRYRLLGEVGRGGMATVYRAHDDVLDRAVAVKLLHHHLLGDATFLERFRREARAAAALNHPHVVAVHDWGETSDAAFLVMQLVDGPSLRDVLHHHGRLSVTAASAMVLTAASGIAAAHEAGLVHRDVKPENLLVDGEGRVRVTDFGLARATASANVTFDDGTLVGSPHYLSPEAVQGDPLTPAADVYALGVILYEALVGEPPHHRDSPYATALAHTTTPVPTPSRSRPDIPEALDEIVRLATARDPAERYHDAAALASALTAAVPEAPGTRVPAIPPTGPGEGADEGHDDDHEGDTDRLGTHAVGAGTATTRIRGGRRRGAGTLLRWGVLVAAVLAALGAGGYAVWDQVLAPVTEIPAVVGAAEADALDALDAAGFEARTAAERPHSHDVAEGHVLGQQPEGTARTGTEVVLTVSAGPRQVQVPSVVGTPEADAVDALQALGLATATERVHDEEVSEGDVVATDPGADAVVDEDSTVTLTVSAGPRPIEVPDVVGDDLDTARGVISDADLELTVDERRFDDSPAGTVLAQHPDPGGELHRGEVVEVVVSDGPRPVEVPALRGEPVGEAAAALEELGFEVVVERRGGFSAFLNPGRVYDQDPAPGATRLPGEIVYLYAYEG